MTAFLEMPIILVVVTIVILIGTQATFSLLIIIIFIVAVSGWVMALRSLSLDACLNLASCAGSLALGLRLDFALGNNWCRFVILSVSHLKFHAFLLDIHHIREQHRIAKDFCSASRNQV